MRPEATFARDLAACSALLAGGSKSLALVARLLPARVRDSVTVLYGFCRIADDLVGADLPASAATITSLRARLDRVYAGAPDDDPVDRALAVVVSRETIPRGLLEALLQGRGWDAGGRRYRTIGDLHAYAARVAGTVGVMMCLLMGCRDAATLARAGELAVAMQLTTIARDVGEDARRGRLYLPLDWLEEEGIAPATLVARPRSGAALARVVRRLIVEAERLYQRAEAGLGRLPADCQVVIHAVRLIYGEIGAEVARAGFDSVNRRAVVSGWRKAWLLARALGPMRAATAPEPPLAAVRFLVALAAVDAQALRPPRARRMHFAKTARGALPLRRAACSRPGSCRASSRPRPSHR